LKPAAGVRPPRASERALIEGVVGEIRRRAAEAHDPATPPDRIAAIVAKDFDGMPTPLGLVRALAERGSRERAREVVEQVSRPCQRRHPSRRLPQDS